MAVQSRRSFLSKAVTAGAAAVSPWFFAACSHRQEFDLIVREAGLRTAWAPQPIWRISDQWGPNTFRGDLSHAAARLEIDARD